MPFNQKDVLVSNKAYLVRSLELQDIHVRPTHLSVAALCTSGRHMADLSVCVHSQFFDITDDIPNVDAKKLETASPGKPAIHLFTQQ